MEKLSNSHCKAYIRVLRYLKGAMEQGLKFSLGDLKIWLSILIQTGLVIQMTES